MDPWIIAALVTAVVVTVGAAVAFWRTRGAAAPDDWSSPRHSQPWDARPQGKPTSTPPPGGLFVGSEELSASVTLESQELLLEEDEPTGPIPRIVVRGAGQSDADPRGETNEDAFLVEPGHEVYAVADGVGAYAAGEVAAETLVATLREVFVEGSFGELDERYPRRGAELVAAVEEGHRRIRALAAGKPSLQGMATTVIAARVSPRRKRIYLAHVGDSRCYRIREDAILRLTSDHTLGALGIEGEQADKLSRAVGALEELEVDLTIDEPHEGDHYLLCSDGLYDALSDAEMLDCVLDTERPSDAVDELVTKARERGVEDDVTAVLVSILAPGAEVDPDQSGAHRLPGI